MVTPETSTVIRQNPRGESGAVTRARARAFEENFKEWYQHYPRKVGGRLARGAAEKALERVLADGVSLETLIEAAKH